MTANNKLSLLRQEMKKENINACIIPQIDPHMSEYVEDFYKLREYLSNFSGSAGTLVVTENKSGIWTDGRYYIQAENELKGSEIKLFKASEKETVSYEKWLISELKQNDTVSVNGEFISIKKCKEIKNTLLKGGITLDVTHDFSYIWKDRPKKLKNKIFLHPIEFCGETVKSKLERVRRYMDINKISIYLLPITDAVMWLYNIRGRDVKNSPLTSAYAIVKKDSAFLYIDRVQADNDIEKELLKSGVTVKDYKSVNEDISMLKNEEILGCDFLKTNALLTENAVCSVKDINDIVTTLKAQKNETEQNGMRNAVIRDCKVLCKVLSWIFQNKENGLNEYSISQKINEIRQKEKYYFSNSFDSIVAYGKNGAMMHYAPNESKNSDIIDGSFLLIDTGGQYLDGTTDITRTFAIGDVSNEMKRDFTLVLKSVLSLIETRFVASATGSMLDSVARYPLWQYGYDYRCGTGHGVGSFLNVHEGPQAITPKSKLPFKIGMTITVEPGIYKENEYGIRTENLCLVKKDETTKDGIFYRLENLSYCPIDTNCIDKSLMSDDEIEKLNKYHKKTREKILPILDDETDKKWLIKATEPI